MVKIRKKHQVEADCYSLARDRLRLCFDRFDLVYVSFSGGKDSTACVQLALEVAREKRRLPLDIVSFDEEAIPPETVEYLGRVSENPDLRFHWYCLPVECRNACSRLSPSWFPWAEEDRDRWCRPLPPRAITELRGFCRQAIPEAAPLIFGPECGTVCAVMGIRTQESMSRYGVIAREKRSEPFLCQATEAPWVTKAYPVYDWQTEDIWLAPYRFGWDYNRAYDVMEAAGLHRLEARCSPPFGEQPIRRLWAYKVCWPGLWGKMSSRVPGAATAARYANTDLYGIGLSAEPTAGQTWRDRVQQRLRTLDADSQREVARLLRGFLDKHYRRTGDLLPDDAQHPQSGYSWRLLYSAVAAGGNKLGRQQVKVDGKAKACRNRNGFY